MTELTGALWESFLESRPESHLLQTAAWGRLKAGFGWQARPFQSGESGALVLFRSLAPGVRMAYIPRGPVGMDFSSLWPEIDQACRKAGAFVLKVEPDCWLDTALVETPVEAPPGLPGFIPSPQHIQPPRTLLVSLEGSEEDILGRMKQKTRYNIRLAEKKGVVAAASGDVAAYHRLALETGKRDRFEVHSREYYQKAFELFQPTGGCILLMASIQGELLSGLMAFRSGQHAYYLYGASSDHGRNLMSTYHLQWEAMKWAKSSGCIDYDLWGVPDAPLETLEREFSNRSDGLWGVYRFKRGFGGVLKRTPGAFDRVYNPAIYRLYLLWLKMRGSNG